MTFREAPPSVATASNKKDLRLASRRYTKTKSAGLVYDRAAHVVLFSSSGGRPIFYVRLRFCRLWYSHSDYRKMNYISLTGVQSRRSKQGA